MALSKHQATKKGNLTPLLSHREKSELTLPTRTTTTTSSPSLGHLPCFAIPTEQPPLYTIPQHNSRLLILNFCKPLCDLMLSMGRWKKKVEETGDFKRGSPSCLAFVSLSTLFPLGTSTASPPAGPLSILSQNPGSAQSEFRVCLLFKTRSKLFPETTFSHLLFFPPLVSVCGAQSWKD